MSSLRGDVNFLRGGEEELRVRFAGADVASADVGVRNVGSVALGSS